MSTDNHRTRTITWEDPRPAFQQSQHLSGLEYMQAMIEGRFPMPPIAHTLRYTLTEVAHGRAVFNGQPDESLYNPIGVVHGGYAMTLLDSALGCAVHTTLPAGMGYTTVQINVHLVRPITSETGPVTAEATVTHGGRRMATAEGQLTDGEGRLLAHGTTTCMVFPLPTTGA